LSEVLDFEVDVNVTVLLAVVVSDAANDIRPAVLLGCCDAGQLQPVWFVLAEKVTACDNR
jgi:hypothetical protein